MSIRSPGLAIYCDCGAPHLSLFFLCSRKRDRGRRFESKLTGQDSVRFTVQPLCVPSSSVACSSTKFYDVLCSSITKDIKSQCPNPDKKIHIEDYAYAVHNSSSPSSLHEITGLLKWMFYKEGWEFSLHSPSRVKSTFAQSGRADKLMMYRRYRELGYQCLYSIFGITSTRTNVPAPISDLVDAIALIQPFLPFNLESQHNSQSHKKQRLE